MSRTTTVLFNIDVPDDLAARITEEIDATTGINCVFPGEASDSELAELWASAEVVVGWRIPQTLLDSATRLKLIVFPGVGVQRLIDPLRALNEVRCVEGRTPVTLLKGTSNTYATAQHTVALLLALLNNVTVHHNWMADGLWRRGDKHAQSITLRNRNVGLLGYGAVNSKVHMMLAGFDVGFGILKREWGKQDSISELAEAAKRFACSEMDVFLEWSDTLIVALPETDATRGLIGAEELSLLGEDGVIVHVGRGPVIDEAALYSALAEQRIAGAAIDVWYDYRPEATPDGLKYPYAAEHPFHELANVVLSPHRAASPVFAPSRWTEVIEQVRRYVLDGQLINEVDLNQGY